MRGVFLRPLALLFLAFGCIASSAHGAEELSPEASKLLAVLEAKGQNMLCEDAAYRTCLKIDVATCEKQAASGHDACLRFSKKGAWDGDIKSISMVYALCSNLGQMFSQPSPRMRQIGECSSKESIDLIVDKFLDTNKIAR